MDVVYFVDWMCSTSPKRCPIPVFCFLEICSFGETHANIKVVILSTITLKNLLVFLLWLCLNEDATKTSQTQTWVILYASLWVRPYVQANSSCATTWEAKQQSHLIINKTYVDDSRAFRHDKMKEVNRGPYYCLEIRVFMLRWTIQGMRSGAYLRWSNRSIRRTDVSANSTHNK